MGFMWGLLAVAAFVTLLLIIDAALNSIRR